MALLNYIAAIAKLEIRSRSFPGRGEGLNRLIRPKSVPAAPIMTVNVCSHRSHRLSFGEAPCSPGVPASLV